jgi:drug/metabolite transporter (DMT)-like permease
MQILTIILYAVISVTGLTLVKLGSGNPVSFAVGQSGFSFGAGWLTLLGLLLYVVSFLIYMTLVAKNNLTYLTPVSSAVVYILTTAVSLIVFRESMTPVQWIGWTLILVGAFLMNLHK